MRALATLCIKVLFNVSLDNPQSGARSSGENRVVEGADQRRLKDFLKLIKKTFSKNGTVFKELKSSKKILASFFQ